MSAVKNIPEGWVETTLGEVCQNISRPFNFSNVENVVFINTSDVLNGKFLHNEYISKIGLPGQAKKAIEFGDILFSEIRPANGRYALVDFISKAHVVSTKFMVIKKNEKIDLSFLYIYLTNSKTVNQFQMIADSRSGTFPQITFDAISHINILLPTIPEQKSIAAILTSFDDKIELLQAQNKTLEETAQTIFKEWFGKYQIGDALPEGWRVGKLSEIAEFLNGLALQKYPAISGQDSLPVIKIRELKQGITSNTDRANKELDSKYIVENGDVLFSWSGSLEVVIWQYGQGALNQHLFKVTSEKYPKWFYYYWTLEHLTEFRGIASDKATTMGHINRNHLDIAKVLIPNKDDFEKLNRLFVPILEKLETNYSQIQSLTQTRDALLPKLMSGELRVTEFIK